MMQTRSENHQLTTAHASINKDGQLNISTTDATNLRKNMTEFVKSLSLTQISKKFSGEIATASKRDQLATRLEKILKAETVPKGLRSNSVANNNSGIWTQACKTAVVTADKRITCTKLMTKLRKSDPIKHLDIWKHVYCIFAPYILFHCTNADHCHLDRAILAHRIWMQWYAVLKEQYGKNYP